MKTKRGAPKKPEHLKKEPVLIKLPRWLIDRLDQEKTSRAVLIERAFSDAYGWMPDQKGHEELMSVVRAAAPEETRPDLCAFASGCRLSRIHVEEKDQEEQKVYTKNTQSEQEN